MKRIWRLLATMLTLTAMGTAATASAHHAFATEYDIDKPVALKGTLTKIEWVNPHGWIYLDVLNPRNGEIKHWAVEFGGPNALLRRGLRKTDFPLGVTVEVHGYLAKSGREVLNGTDVKLPDGRDFFTGSSGPGAPPGPGGQ